MKPSIPFPEKWASDWGQDEYGFWMAFRFKGVRQAFRWIPPGEFLMGSPENEPERLDRELQHRVTISKGFWLAETACTQELWQAVMTDNPSHFKGSSNPMDNMSWNDAMRFIETLNGIKPGLELRLPTEAEWEYACRAGTTTPFNFGDDITPAQVNYFGDSYRVAKKDIFRGETVAVKSLPCNAWGIFEMHGNVWEWCSDWYAEYPSGDAVDPRGPPGGSGRVLRGGAWFDVAGLVRSAYRGRFDPGFRISDTGFRLARGQREEKSGEN